MYDLQKIVKLVLLTGNLKNTKPVSLLIVSKSGNGKTELITSFKKKSVAFVTDTSYQGLLSLLKDEPHIKHLIIPDFIKITQKKRSTTDNLVSLLNAVTEEGIGRMKVYNTDYDYKGRQLGLITATTKASFSQKRNAWETFGFVQRMILVSYDYADDTIEEILSSINKKEWLSTQKSNEKIIKYASKDMITKEELFKQLNQICDKRFRTLKHLQSLCEAHALLRGDNEVKQEDIDEIIRLSRFMNLKYTKI